ncbi:MAG: glycoside hydrolase family 10 protein [Polyangiales bacterium]
MRSLAMIIAFLGIACSPTSPSGDDGGALDDAAAQDGAARDGAARDAAPADVDEAEDTNVPVDAPDTTVAVSHSREMRGVWIATVSNINWPSSRGLSVEAQQAELDALFARTAELGFNAVFFQVRAEADAFYPSELEPWSRFLTGTQGQDPGYDPLAYAIDVAHQRGLELHAWLNPYRAATSRTRPTDASHVSNTIPDAVVDYGNFQWLDPGSAAAEEHTLAVVRDVVSRYDIDGLHFDDYFYPYPNESDFPDGASYARYQSGGGTLGRGDWRRDNVNRMVRRVSEVVAEVNANVRFGISPFGIYRPGIPEGTTGLDQYDAIYADPPVWIREGWVDYLAPQLYWPSTQTRQAYEPLTEWWGALAQDGRSIWVGNYLSQLGSSAAWDLDEVREQIRITRANAPEVNGNIMFQIAPLMENRMGVADAFRDVMYADPALSPPHAGAAEGIAAPTVVAGDPVMLSHSDRLRGYAVYREVGGDFVLDRVLPRDATSVTLEAGRYAISAVSLRGVESRGQLVER